MADEPIPGAGSPVAPEGNTPPAGSTPDAASTDAPLLAPPAAPAGAPEQYEAFTLSEDITGVASDEVTTKEFSDMAREMGLSQQQAQTLYEFGAKKASDGMEAVRLEVIKRRQEWRDTAEKDSELMAGLEHAKRAVATATDRGAFDQMMSETGIGDNPVFIRWCIQMGKLLGEGTVAQSQSGGKASEPTLLDMARHMYPNMGK